MTLETSYDDASASPGLAMWRATHGWQAAQRAALRPHGLTHVQFVLLASLVYLDEEVAVTQRRLAQHAGTDPMMTSQVLRALEGLGLVERRPHPTDARARWLVATPEGVQLANRAIVSVETVDRAFFAPLGGRTAELTAMLTVLTGIAGITGAS